MVNVLLAWLEKRCPNPHSAFRPQIQIIHLQRANREQDPMFACTAARQCALLGVLK